MINTVCDSCCDYAYDQGILDYDDQVFTMLQAGDVVDTHQCDHVVEPEILCDCGCRGK